MRGINVGFFNGQSLRTRCSRPVHGLRGCTNHAGCLFQKVTARQFVFFTHRFSSYHPSVTEACFIALHREAAGPMEHLNGYFGSTPCEAGTRFFMVCRSLSSAESLQYLQSNRRKTEVYGTVSVVFRIKTWKEFPV